MLKKKLISFVTIFIVMFCYLSSIQASDNAASDIWTTKTSMNEARVALGVAIVQGKIYAIGGDSAIGITGTVEEYDPINDTWSFKSPMPTPKYAFATVSYQNKIYCFGGKTNGYSAISNVEVYNPADDTWQTLTPMPMASMNLQAVVKDDKIYLFGGRSSDNSDNVTNFSFNELYNPATDSWTAKAPMPQAGPCMASMVDGDKIYVLTLNTTLIYDLKNDVWSQGNSSPSQGFWFGAATVGTNAPKGIFVFGESTVDMYNPKTNSWINYPSNLTLNYYPAVAVLNDKFYVIGGYSMDYSQYNATSQFPLFFQPQEKYMTTNLQYTPANYGSPDLLAASTEITILSPENITYDSSSIELILNVSEPVSWLGYSLDEKKNITLTGNSTLTALSNGSHELIIYGNNTDGATTASQPVIFTVNATPIIEQAMPIVGIVAVSSSVCGAVYFLKHKRAVVNRER